MMNSPDYYLDQTESYKAIDEFQLFMSKYPNSYLIDSCNNMVTNLRNRLELKSFEKENYISKWKNIDRQLSL